MEFLFRRIGPHDVDQLFAVRTGVSENVMTMDDLAGMGITPRSIADGLGNALAGYLCQTSGRTVGFAMADLKSGEFTVLAVLAGYEGRGIGRELLKLTEELLWSAGHRSIWLWTGTDRGARALRLYLNAGWVETEVKERKIYLKKDRPWTDEVAT